MERLLVTGAGTPLQSPAHKWLIPCSQNGCAILQGRPRQNRFDCMCWDLWSFMGCNCRAQALMLVWARCIEVADAAWASCEANAALIVLFVAILENFIS